MSQLQFNEERVLVRNKLPQTSSVERFIFKYSFGLITTKIQVTKLFVVLTVIFLMASFINMQKNADNEYPVKPSEDLINAVQPTGR